MSQTRCRPPVGRALWGHLASLPAMRDDYFRDAIRTASSCDVRVLLDSRRRLSARFLCQVPGRYSGRSYLTWMVSSQNWRRTPQVWVSRGRKTDSSIRKSLRASKKFSRTRQQGKLRNWLDLGLVTATKRIAGTLTGSCVSK